jgi:predicted dehydrogenase
VKIFHTLDEAVRSGVELDLMILPVGIGSHKEMTEISLKAGWNVMVEKPLAGSVEEAEAIVRMSEQSDRFVAVGFQDMYGSMALDMKDAVLSGVIGEVCSVRVLGIWGRSVDYFNRNAWAGRLVYNGQPIYDSPFNNAFAHYLNLALFLAGPDRESAAVPVSVDGSMWRAHAIESCDTANLCWQTEGGPDVSVFFSHASSGSVDPEIIVMGTQGSLRWGFQSYWEICADGAAPVRQAVPSAADMRRAMIRQLVEKVNDSGVFVYTPRQALAQVMAAELAYEHVDIQDIPESLIRRSMTTNEVEKVSVMLDVEGLEAAGRRFFEGADDFFCPAASRVLAEVGAGS